MDQETSWTKIVSVEKIFDRKTVRLHYERDTFRLDMEVTLDHITNRIEEVGQSFLLDDWAEPSPNFFLGVIGMLVDKN
jgi:hypothetical protein